MLESSEKQLLEAAQPRVPGNTDLQPVVLWIPAQSAAKASISPQLEAEAAAVELAAVQKADREAKASYPAASTLRSPPQEAVGPQAEGPAWEREDPSKAADP